MSKRLSDAENLLDSSLEGASLEPSSPASYYYVRDSQGEGTSYRMVYHNEADASSCAVHVVSSVAKGTPIFSITLNQPQFPSLRSDDEASSSSDPLQGPKNVLAFILEEGRALIDDPDDSRLSGRIHQFVRDYRELAIGLIHNSLQKEGINTDVVREVLISLARLRDAGTYERRFRLFKHCLKSKSLMLRDAAILCFDILNDKAAIPVLDEALAVESHSGIRKDIIALKEVLVQ